MKPLSESTLHSKWDAFRTHLARRTVGVNTGIKPLDDYLGGVGGLVSIQGETSSCKSVLGLQIAHYNLWTYGTPCLMIDKENGDGRVLMRMLCQKNRLSEDQIKALSPEEREALEETIDPKHRMHLHTESISKHQEFEEQVYAMWELYKKPFVVLFDSIQAADLILPEQRVNLEQWVYLIDRLKVELAGKATFIIISEKNRSSYNQQGTGGGKGSNVVDYKPETILDIRWNAEEGDKFWVHVAKHRDGQRGGTIKLQKKFSDPNNKRSFCFLLEADDIEREEAEI
jgi:KaiC/GvpD/RAD55 family RecA-like ATPase